MAGAIRERESACRLITPEVEQRAAQTQKWICERDLELPGNPEQLMSALRVHLLKAKQRKLLKNSRDAITSELLKKVDPISPDRYDRLKLEKDQYPPKQVIQIIGGMKDFKRTKQGLFFDMSFADLPLRAGFGIRCPHFRAQRVATRLHQPFTYKPA